MESWTELRTAYHVARLGTVSAASRVLQTHRATVNRHIDVLEEELGRRIFLRNPKGYTLTEFGNELLKVAQKADELIEDLVGRAQRGDGSIEGEIKITSVLPLTTILMEPIKAFRAANPKCQVTITATEDLQRLEYGEAHVALRAGRKPEHPDYVVQSYGSAALNLYAHSDYLWHLPDTTGMTNLRAHSFIMPPKEELRLPIWSWLFEQVPEPRIAIAASDPLVVKDAVLSGLGVGVLSDIEVLGCPSLTALLPDNTEWCVPLWLVTHVDLHRTEKVQDMLARLKAHRT